VSPFGNIARLFAGDLAAKALQFLTFIYLARVLGVGAYGVLELALAATSYLVLVGDWGLELWATRQVSREADLRGLAGRVFGLRIALGIGVYLLFLAFVPLFPEYPSLRALLVLGGLALFGNILSLRWALLGRERMVAVASGSVVAQLVTAAIVLATVRTGRDVLWVPVARVAGDLVVAGLYARAFSRVAEGPPRRPALSGWREVASPAAAMGAIQILGILSYNFDSLLLGLLVGPTSVGLYGAAYKIVTVGIAVSMTYYMGLFPALARSWEEGQEAFLAVARRSFGLSTISAFPVAVAGTLLAAPAIELLFGPEYGDATGTLRILCWSAALVGLRGTFRNGLTAAGAQSRDLAAAAIATGVNVGLNVLFIPLFGLLGAASATVVADVVWLLMAWFYFEKRCGSSRFARAAAPPAVASAVLAVVLVACRSIPVHLLSSAPSVRAAATLLSSALLGGLAYVGTLVALGEPETRAVARRAIRFIRA